MGLWRKGQANRSKSRWDEPPRWRLACVECVGVDRADYNPHAVFASLNEPSSSLWDKVLLPVLILAFSTVGALVASYRPENAICWLFLSGAFVWIVGEFTLEYGVYALITDPGALPAGVWAAWFGAWARGLGWFVIVTFLLLLFPTGRLPSPRWRPVLWGAVGFIVLSTLTSG